MHDELSVAITTPKNAIRRLFIFLPNVKDIASRFPAAVLEILQLAPVFSSSDCHSAQGIVIIDLCVPSMHGNPKGFKSPVYRMKSKNKRNC